MSDELIDIFNESNEPIGLLELKSKAHREGLWHRASHIWIYNSKGEIILQLRSKTKKLFPNKWDVSVGGHIAAGEEPLTTAVRETKEELDFEITGDDLEFIATYQKEMVDGEIDNKEFYYAYLLKYDGLVDNLVLQADEVSEVKFMSIAKLEEELKNNPEEFTPHGDYWFFIIEKIKKNNNMKIAICASISFTNKIKEVSDQLSAKGHIVELPFTSKKIINGELTLEEFLKEKKENGDGALRKIHDDLIRHYYEIIKNMDAVLVLNMEKNGIENYIGGNTLIEMAFAHVLDKKVFLLNPVPDISYKDEIMAMQPIILNGNLEEIR